MKLYERENIYRKVGFERNPFSMALEPQIIKDYIYQRESGRVLKEIRDKKVLVLRFSDESTMSDFTDFYTYLTNTFLRSPDSSYLPVGVSGTAFLHQRLLGVITKIRNSLHGEIVGRIYRSYFAEKVIAAHREGRLKEQLPGLDAEELYRKTLETKGANLVAELCYEPEEVSRDDFESEEEYEKRKKEEEELVNRREELRRFFYSQIEADSFGPAVTSSLRAVIHRGLEDGPASMISASNPKMDLIGILKFLSYSYSNLIFSFFNLGQIPFLDDEELVAYESVITEAEAILKKFATVLHLCRMSDLQVVPDVFEGKPNLELNFSTDFLSVDGEAESLNSKEQFKSLALYMLGVGESVPSQILLAFEDLSIRAFETSGGNTREAMRILERAFDSYALSGTLEQVKV